MSCSGLSRLRALCLLVALGVGLLTQSVAAMALGSVMSVPQDMTPSVSSPMSGMSNCPGCVPSTAMTPGCVVPFCVASVAILEPGAQVEATGHSTFPMVAYGSGQGITVRPTLGPPRSIRQS